MGWNNGRPVPDLTVLNGKQGVLNGQPENARYPIITYAGGSRRYKRTSKRSRSRSRKQKRRSGTSRRRRY